MLGQVKASALNNEQNKGTAEALFTKDKDFFKDFGLSQIVDSLEYLDNNSIAFDSTLHGNEILEVYPVIILNDSLASTIMLPMLFQKELTNRLSLRIFKKLIVTPITLIHIQDFERLSPLVKKHQLNTWNILESNFSNSLFPKPLYVTLNRLGINETDFTALNLSFIKLEDEE
ncbi:MAG: hypothetical protein ACK40V_05040 [Anaerolineales bacterium]